jgi:hypothetical protein
MNGDEISKLLRKDKVANKYFYGVYPIDMLPNINFIPASLVLNTDPSYLPGAHWIAVYIDRNRECFFFDSFGYHPSIYKVEKYLRTISTSITYNKSQIQSLASETCGLYCIYFIILMSRGFDFNYIIDVFPKKNLILMTLLLKK